jgi:DNA transformation protein
MKKDSSYHDFIVYDLLNKLPHVSSRAMMGGWCIYSNKIPFAMIIENQLYLKAKGDLAEKLAENGWKKFTYEKSNGKTFSMSYWLVPDKLIDSQEKLMEIVEELLN